MVINPKKEVVGRNPDSKTPLAPSATPKATQKPVFPPVTAKDAPAAQDNIIDTINRKNAAGGLPQLTPEKSNSLKAQVGYTDPQLVQIGRFLKKLGYPIKPLADSVRNTIEDNPELKSIQEKFPLYSDFVNKLSEAYLPGLDTGGSTAFTGPSRSIYKYSDEDVNNLISNVYKTKLMREPTAEELARDRAVVRPQLEQGTVSTTKLVKNKKTGVTEQVTTQQAGPTKEAVATTIEEQLAKLNPDEADRASRINFSTWISQNAQGA